MEREKLDYYRRKLIKEKRHMEELCKHMKENDTFGLYEMASELSYYDNHPSDVATELDDMEKAVAINKNEVSIIRKIDNALDNIENGTFGICKRCNKDINESRLEVVPYADYCVKCQNEINALKHGIQNDEDLLREGHEANNYDYENDQYLFQSLGTYEDNYKALEAFNKVRPREDYDGSYCVEPIEKISNAQYKSQLPD